MSQLWKALEAGKLPLDPADVAKTRELITRWAERKVLQSTVLEVWLRAASEDLNALINEIVINRGASLGAYADGPVSAVDRVLLKEYLGLLVADTTRFLELAIVCRIEVLALGLPADAFRSALDILDESELSHVTTVQQMQSVAQSLLERAYPTDPAALAEQYRAVVVALGTGAADAHEELWRRDGLVEGVTLAFDEWMAGKADAVPGTLVIEDGDTIEEHLFYVAMEAADTRLETRQRNARAVDFVGEPPSPQPYGVSNEGAEALVAAWMVHLGVPDAHVTRYSADGGIDVESSDYVAQVKNYGGSVSVTDVRELHGVAAVENKRGLFFTTQPYPAGAIAFAEKAGVALFLYDAIRGRLTGVGALGERLRMSGLGLGRSEDAQ